MSMPRVGWGGMSDSKYLSDLGEATMSGLKKNGRRNLTAKV